MERRVPLVLEGLVAELLASASIIKGARFGASVLTLSLNELKHLSNSPLLTR